MPFAPGKSGVAQSTVTLGGHSSVGPSGGVGVVVIVLIGVVVVVVGNVTAVVVVGGVVAVVVGVGVVVVVGSAGWGDYCSCDRQQQKKKRFINRDSPQVT